MSFSLLQLNGPNWHSSPSETAVLKRLCSPVSSNIRHKDFRPFVCPLSRSGYPPWILKQAGLESSGRRLISSIGKTKKNAFFCFWQKKKYFQNFQIFWNIVIFSDFRIVWPFLTIFGFFGFFYEFLNFFGYFGFFWIFWIFLDFLDFLDVFWIFGFFEIFWNYLDFFGFIFFWLLLLMLLLKITKVTTGHKKLPKMGQNSIISSFFARRAKKASAEGRSPPQELEVSPRSGLYLLVQLIIWCCV